MEVKIQCDCGAKFRFEVEPVNGQMPQAVNCPECASDRTGAANAQIQANLAAAQLPTPQAEPTAPAGLRVIKAAPPVPVSAPIVRPNVYVCDPESPPADEPARCKYHPGTYARWMCVKCLQCYCEVCVSTRPAGVTHKVCRSCGSECSPLTVAIVPEGADKENFFANIPGAFTYPFKGDGVMFLVAGSIFFALLEFLRMFAFFPMIAVWSINVIYVGYTFAFVQKLIQTAALGSDEPPSWPDIADFWQDIFVPFLQTTALFLLCFGPAFVFAIYVGFDLLMAGEVDVAKLVIAGILTLVGALYFPMAFLALAMSDSLTAVNPFVVIAAILKIPLEYSAVLFVAAVIVGTKVVQQVLFYFLPIHVLAHLLAAAFALYFLTVQSRLLGLMYFANRDRLGWFYHRPLF
jgi:hypothetical protein